MVYRTVPRPHPIVFLHGQHATAVDPDTGEEVWTYVSRRRFARMTFANDNVYLLDTDCVVHCLVAATGAPLATITTGPLNAWGAALITDGRRVFVASTENLTALGEDGRVLWSLAVPPYAVAGLLPGLGLPGQVVQPDFKD